GDLAVPGPAAAPDLTRGGNQGAPAPGAHHHGQPCPDCPIPPPSHCAATPCRCAAAPPWSRARAGAAASAAPWPGAWPPTARASTCTTTCRTTPPSRGEPTGRRRWLPPSAPPAATPAHAWPTVPATSATRGSPPPCTLAPPRRSAA